jgi:hypothetical protein
MGGCVFFAGRAQGRPVLGLVGWDAVLVVLMLLSSCSRRELLARFIRFFFFLLSFFLWLSDRSALSARLLSLPFPFSAATPSTDLHPPPLF